jgi:hypothetical protein
MPQAGSEPAIAYVEHGSRRLMTGKLKQWQHELMKGEM